MSRSGNTKRTRTWGSLAAAALAFALPFVVDLSGLSEAGHRVLSVFLLAVVLWVFEPIPLHATAVLVIILEILLVSDQALTIPSGPDPLPYSSYFAALANPVLMLFLGGFVLAAGASKYRLDRGLARVMLKPFGSSPSRLVLGVMLITALLSMFMSNTATTATMMAVLVPVMAGLPPGDRSRVGLALSVPVAANVGGIGTPVGTPPNAIAIGQLAANGVDVSFSTWMVRAIPAMLVLLAVAWILLVRLFPSTSKTVTVEISGTFARSREAYVFYGVFVLTVVAWLTESLHGLSSNVVGFLPVVILLATGSFTVKDLQQVQWHVLWLVGGGIALGTGVAASGLDVWLVGLVDWTGFPTALVAAGLGLFTLALSTVISNSATANLVVPIGITLALSGAVDLDPFTAGFVVAIGASLAMALPISTPPNAIAHATGTVTTGDMAKVGLVVGAVGLVLFLWLGPLLWTVMGVAP
jgi:sodium-dependent dicarboxylate transporter 2/3/5